MAAECVLFKGLGIAGDSFTFLGSIALALETLLRQRTVHRRRDTVDTAEHLREGGFEPVDAKEQPVSEQSVEDREILWATISAWIGVGFLIVGFGLLLVKGIWGD